LSDLVAKTLFRADLYYRLSGAEVHVRPLRSRRADTPELARYFLARDRHIRELTLSQGAEDALRSYARPRRPRAGAADRARRSLAETDRIELDDLPRRYAGNTVRHHAALVRAHEIAPSGVVTPALLTAVFDKLRGGALAPPRAGTAAAWLTDAEVAEGTRRSVS
jgi:DNA-binding NtrC family response regulator